ncbi:MAG: methyltransferase regulatory domain-containing protein [Verrucomicrobiota bacterium]
MNPTTTSYDAVPYASHPHPQTHPDRLAVMARLFGLRPARIDRCRVLEVGCSTGGNLLPMACGLPQSEFIGIDLAGTAVQGLARACQELGLTNLRPVHGSLAEITPDWGPFDYIIAHGIYSWIPSELRQRLLATCRECLAPEGIAYISYNVLPGCHLRRMLREMMLFHVRHLRAPEERVGQSLAFLRFLAEAQEAHDDYRVWMKGELERTLEVGPSQLFHDDLAEVNEPIYFTQFIEQARSAGLQYVGEADYFEMSDQCFHSEVRQTLQQLAADRILREQYLDFLKCRRFRQTLLCRQDNSLRAEADTDVVFGLVVGSAAECARPPVNLLPGVHCTFETGKGARVETDFCWGKAALLVLRNRWPASLPFGELYELSAQSLAENGMTEVKSESARRQLAGFLLQLYSIGLVEFRMAMPSMAPFVSEKPAASALVRWQVQQGNFATSAFHSTIKIEDEVGRFLLSSLDGTKGRAELMELLWAFLQQKKAVVVPERDASTARSELEAELGGNLEKLARLGLLMA